MTSACAGSDIYGHSRATRAASSLLGLYCRCAESNSSWVHRDLLGLINDRQEMGGCHLAILPYVPLEFEKKSALTSIAL
jgi:hypothetical protein